MVQSYVCIRTQLEANWTFEIFICCHIPVAISSLDFIGPEDTQLGDLKITQLPKLVHLTLILPDNDSISRDKARGNKDK